MPRFLTVISLILFLFAPGLAGANGPRCSEQALDAAKKLFAFHSDIELPLPSSVSFVKNHHLATKLSRTKDGTSLEIFEIEAWTGAAGYYNMLLSFLVVNNSCNLVAQDIQESWIDERF